MPPNPYKNIPLDYTKVSATLEAFGATGLQHEDLNEGKLVQHTGSFNGTAFLIKIFVGGDGKCTIGYATGYDRATHDLIAAQIRETCGFGSTAPVNISVPRFPPADSEQLLEFLEERGVRKVSDEQRAEYRIVRLKGPLNDALTLKIFNNGTLQLQGIHGQVAGWSLDLIQTLFPLDQVLAHQKAVYEVPISVDQIRHDLEARIPHAHDYLHDVVRIELSSALALTKVSIALEDYAAIAFPALRSLEGFCFQVLAEEVGVDPNKLEKLGDFFHQVGTQWRMVSTYHGTASTEVQAALVRCYKLWLTHRHRLFHMDGVLNTTRILDTREEAVTIVDTVLDAIEADYRTIAGARIST
ncbi:RNase LS family HEPN domain-containing protein [Luteimonas sp. TWI662]|uniref:RNase LS family HEPN domain-containing protein n=1 Tax=Luteimonas sp. TWI662 TaxID=3136789 RepID=UPI003207D952